jgi:hypothetical protein
MLAFIAGCGEDNSRDFSLEEELDTLRLEKTDLARQVEKANAQNQKLQKQMQILAGLKENIKPEKIYDLQNVKIGRYTNLFDKDKDGKEEKLIVYLQPIDDEGDVIKAAGKVDVELWDLSKKSENAKIGQWRVEPDELKKLWFATVVTINYRLTFDISDKVDKFETPLTVKITFTDYLTGKVFKHQKVITPQ